MVSTMVAETEGRTAMTLLNLADAKAALGGANDLLNDVTDILHALEHQLGFSYGVRESILMASTSTRLHLRLLRAAHDSIVLEPETKSVGTE